MSPPSSTLCFLSCFPLSLFTSVIVYLYLLPLTSYVHIKDPCLASSKAGNLCPPFLALSHAFTSFGMCGSVCLSEHGGVSSRSCVWVEGGSVACARSQLLMLLSLAHSRHGCCCCRARGRGNRCRRHGMRMGHAACSSS